MHSALGTPGITGLILAGGLAQRMGGVNKGLQLLQGRPLIEWVISRLQNQVATLMISANDPAAYADYGLPVIPDELPQLGPLAGVMAGLKAATTDWLVTAPCDAPHLPLDLVARLHASLRDSHADLAVASTADGLQPVFALMRRSDWPLIHDYLKSGRRRADGWYGELQVARVHFDNSAAFANINTLETLAAMNGKT